MGVVLVIAAGISPLHSRLQAQLPGAVSGRVVGADTSEGITNASVELVGHGAVLTTPDGLFRFAGVPLREYVLRVSALGYASASTVINVQADIVVDVVLAIAPLRLDSILVVAREIDFDGRVLDPVRDTRVVDALVLTDRGHEESTNLRGHFDLDDVLEGVPLHVRIRAFGYLPVDTVFVPDDDRRYDFDLAVDPLVEEMISVQHRRLANRAGELLYEYRPALTRDLLARHMGSGTLETIVEARYPPAVYRRIACVLIDDVPVYSWERAFVIRSTIPEDLERIEIVEIPGPGLSYALRVYTRRYFMELIAGTALDNLELQQVERPCGQR